MLRPSAALDCADCVREEPGQGGGPPTLLLPPGLRFERAMKLLQPYARYRVWRLSLGGVGSAKRAFGGFDDPGAADRFDKRVQHITADWCCRCVRGACCCVCIACVLPKLPAWGGLTTAHNRCALPV